MEFLSKSGLSFFKSLLDLYFATKSYVNKAISTNTGKFWGTFNDLADLQEITGSNGDYAYVIVPDDYSTSYDRYKWQDNQWVYEYTVGGEAFDDDQWAAINSGITASDKARLNEISDNIGNNSISEMRSDIDEERVHADSLIFDVTKENSGATFASLSALLSSPNLSTLIPTSVRTGGMTIRFVLTSDNKYVQYFCNAQSFTTNMFAWEKINIEEEVNAIIKNTVLTQEQFTKKKSQYVVWENGRIASAEYIDAYYYNVDDKLAKKVTATLAENDTTDACIAFYSSTTPSQESYISGVRAQNSASYNVEADVPENCKTIIVCNKKDLLATPTISIEIDGVLPSQIKDLQDRLGTDEEALTANIEKTEQNEDNIEDIMYTKGSTNLYNDSISKIYLDIDNTFSKFDSSSHRKCFILPVDIANGDKISVKKDNRGHLRIATSSVYPAVGVSYNDYENYDGQKVSISLTQNDHYVCILYYIDNASPVLTEEQALAGMKVCYGDWENPTNRIDEIDELIEETKKYENKLAKINSISYILKECSGYSLSFVDTEWGRRPEYAYEHFYTLFDALLNNNPEYVSRVNCLTDSGIEVPAYFNDTIHGYFYNEHGETLSLPLFMYHFKPTCYNESSLMKVFMIGGIHGETVGQQSLYEFCRILCEENEESIAELRNCIDLYVIPVSNPSSYFNNQVGGHGRTNWNLVDINRNFPTNEWEESGAGTDFYSGPNAMSEYETKVLVHYINEVQPDIMFDIHNSYTIPTGNLLWVDKMSSVLVDKCCEDVCNRLSRIIIKDNVDDIPKVYNSSPTKVVKLGNEYTSEATSDLYTREIYGIPTACLEGVSAFPWDDGSVISTPTATSDGKLVSYEELLIESLLARFIQGMVK